MMTSDPIFFNNAALSTVGEQSLAKSAIHDALAILDAISQGSLFDAVPQTEGERQRLKTGIRLLELLEARLRQAVENEDDPANGPNRRAFPGAAIF